MLRVVQRADPDRVSVLFPDPGFEPGYVAEAKKRTHDLLVQYCIPPSQVTRAAAGNAVAAWRALTTHPLERIDKENVSYLMTGTKPHSIALVLRALALGRYPTVLYVVPEEHAVLRTRPNGVYWRYDVSDVTALPWG